MGFLDKVKEKAAEAIEQGKDVAATQQLKQQLKKLEGEEEEALTAFGNAAFTLYEAGTLSMSSDLAAAAERIRTARAAIEEKKAEASAAGAEDTEEAATSA
jgi:ABC-type Zn2+ transport system substrate-binding protein/surface adhesin